jgi:hypothetical protein
MRRGLAVVMLFAVALFFSGGAEARQGCCSHHGGVCGCQCCDGTPLSAKCLPYYPACQGESAPGEQPPADMSEPTVDKITTSPTAFDGHHVTVSGTVRSVLAKTSHRGNDYETFSLCEKSCVKVFTWGHPQIREGQRLEVKGTFKAVKSVGQYTFRNEIEADKGSLSR